MYGWCVWRGHDDADPLVEPGRDVLHLRAVEVHALVDVRVLVAGRRRRAGGRRGGRLDAALVQQHDDRLDAAARARASSRARWRWRPRGRKSRPATPDGVTTVGVPSKVMPMKRDLRVADLLDLVGREDRLVRCRRRTTLAARYLKSAPRERRAVLAAVDRVAAGAAALVAVLHALQLGDRPRRTRGCPRRCRRSRSSSAPRSSARRGRAPRRSGLAPIMSPAPTTKRVRVLRPQRLDVRGEVGDAARRDGLLRPRLRAAGGV